MEQPEEVGDGLSEETPQKATEKEQETLEEERDYTASTQRSGFEEGSKAGQKAKKKQVEDEITKLSSELQEKHADQLASLGYSKDNDKEKEKGDLDTLVKAIAGVSVNSQGESSKPSKSLKRHEKRAQQEAVREQRIQEEQSNIVSVRVIENDKLDKKLEPLGLVVNEIKPDGNCLYRAVENQLAVLSGGSSPYTYQQLREKVAGYMRQHASDFLPFFLSENNIEVDNDKSVSEIFEKNCSDAESTAAWGGQLELGALTHCLRKHILVFSGSFPDVEMGKEYKSNTGTSLSNPTFMPSYHKACIWAWRTLQLNHPKRDQVGTRRSSYFR